MGTFPLSLFLLRSLSYSCMHITGTCDWNTNCLVELFLNKPSKRLCFLGIVITRSRLFVSANSASRGSTSLPRSPCKAISTQRSAGVDDMARHPDVDQAIKKNNVVAKRRINNFISNMLRNPWLQLSVNNSSSHIYVHATKYSPPQPFILFRFLTHSNSNRV